jgi:hypothetical protein
VVPGTRNPSFVVCWCQCCRDGYFHQTPSDPQGCCTLPFFNRCTCSGIVSFELALAWPGVAFVGKVALTQARWACVSDAVLPRALQRTQAGFLKHQITCLVVAALKHPCFGTRTRAIVAPLWSGYISISKVQNDHIATYIIQYAFRVLSKISNVRAKTSYFECCLTLFAVQTDRRAALAGLASVPALLAASPAKASYGEGANVFGKMTNTSGVFVAKAAQQLHGPSRMGAPTQSCMGRVVADDHQ